MSMQPWEKFYPPNHSWNDPLAPKPIESYLDAAATQWPDAAAIDFYGRDISFLETRALAARAAQGLQELGVGPGVNVGLCLLNTPHYIVCFFAVLMAGGRVVNFAPYTASRDLESQVVDSDVQVLVTLGIPSLHVRIAALKGVGKLRTVVVCGLEDFVPVDVAHSLAEPCPPPASSMADEIDFAKLIANAGAYVRHPRGALEDEIAVLQYTGGTSGKPKGAMLTHANFSVVPHVAARWVGDRVGSDSSILVVLPFSHIFGLVVTLLAVASGAKMVLHLRFEPEKVLADIARKKIGAFFGVPSMYAALVFHPAIGKFDLSALRLCASGGASLPAKVLQRFRELTGISVLEGYSLTEITSLGTWQVPGMEPVAGTVGVPLPQTLLEVVDLETATRVLPLGESGEICFSGPQVMKGYWKNAQATAEAFRGGRFHSGDIGFITPDGYVTLIDRKKDVIVVGGHKVFPRKVEDTILEHPAVAEVGVIGTPVPGLGEQTKAFVTLRPGSAGLTFEELRTFLEDKLDRYEMPIELEVRDSLPRTAAGKLAKKELAAETAPRFEQGRAEGTMSPAPSAIDAASLGEKTTRQLRDTFAKIANLSTAAVDVREPLERYGIDSIMITALTRELSRVFEELTTTVFYDYQTLADLAAHLLETYPQRCAAWSGVAEHVPALPARAGGRARQSAGRPSMEAATREPIAIIGMTGRYAKAHDLDQYWHNLVSGMDCISEVPPDRWSLEEYFDPDPEQAIAEGKSYSKWGGFIEGFANFDPLFFGVSPRDALTMDPQERLFIQSCWEVLEDAAYTRERLTKEYRGRIGVFAGITNMGYELYGPDLWRVGKHVFPYTWFSSVANRASYLLNLRGPSMPVDTMCSSSLTAVHEACEHLLRDECEMAIAGGVNVYVHPAIHIVLCTRRMLSVDGRCKTFGKGGNGYVPGEGVGTVLLKRLSRAIADEDHIYAVIRASSINHGGKTNGYTVPSPGAQADLIQTALQKAGVHPRTISYIEAHGTGTELGDPIEIAGLTKAFRTGTLDTRFCAIGSAKSNIGHCESAAGIAGLTKVVLQMQHRTLVPSLHSEVPNPNINFGETPFVVQRSTAPWERPMVATAEGKTKEYPRIAGISSFGAGGSNAHLILEEYVPAQEVWPVTAVTAEAPALVVVSARSEAGLKEQVARLLRAVDARGFVDRDLADIAYTLQVGREAMEVRLASTVTSLEELRGKWRRFLDGASGIEDCYYGQIKSAQDPLALLMSDEDLQAAVDAWIVKRKYAKLLDLWARGFTFDWNRLYGETRPRRISLPTYPFARERFWIADAERTRAAGVPVAGETVGVLHPLLHRNTSDFSVQRFSSVFTGKEFFLADHVVKGQRILPGVAYLEMAHAAVSYSLGVPKQGTDAASDAGAAVLRLKNVVWARPMVVAAAAAAAHVRVAPEESDEVSFEIYTEGTDESTVHAQGRCVLLEPAQPESVDLAALLARCDKTIAASDCYTAFRQVGFEYGPAHRSLDTLSVGADAAGRSFVVARLVLPKSTTGTEQSFTLHPSLMDGALQAAVGLALGAAREAEAVKPTLPFALGEINVFRSLRSTVELYAWVRLSENSRAGDKVQKLDIDLVDASGSVCVQVKELAGRALEGYSADALVGALVVTPGFQPRVAVRDPGCPAPGAHWLIIAQPLGRGECSLTMPPSKSGVRCLVLGSDRSTLSGRFQDYALQLFEAIKRILNEKPRNNVLVQLLIPDGDEEAPLLGLAGVLKSASLENPKLITQLIAVTYGESSARIREWLEESAESHEAMVCYRDGQRLAAALTEATSIPTPMPLWQDQGVYLITGGAGGLGLIFARAIARQAKNAVVVLTGRSPLDARRQAQLKAIADLGVHIDYQEADVTRLESVDALVKEVLARHGKLDGVIHAAGMIQDNFIIKKSADEFTAVLAPKVVGTENLDQATRDVALQFFILFSSTSGTFGNFGQSDYATANAFLDGFAMYRNSLARKGERRGRVLSINWPLWADGGMRVSSTTITQMREMVGLIPLTTDAGLDSFERAVALGKEQVLVVYGERTRLRALLAGGASQLPAISPAAVPPAEQRTGVAGEQLQEATVHYLKTLLGSSVDLTPDRIEADAPLENYGIDSIMVMQMTNELEKVFGSLSKTLFFEYQTLAALAEYFLEAYRERLVALLGVEAKAQPAAVSPPKAAPAPAPATAPRPMAPAPLEAYRHSRFDRAAVPRAPVPAASTDIAIIGIAGRYPQARTLDEFWANLTAGRDSVTDIPKERWDHSLHFDPDKRATGKTYSRWGGFIDGVDEFDPLFFNISPREAELMDPQERLFLQCVHELLEDAGYTRESLRRYQGAGLESSVGVFVGAMYQEYQLYGAQAQALGHPLPLVSNASSIANRVSYFCNFHGPSIALDTMCSSSLTAIHLACRSLRDGECELAVAGGVNVSVHPNKYLWLALGRFIASNGRCVSFGEGGDGYVPGEGVGAVLLKPLHAAIADDDHIYGVIKATAINHGGKTNGYTVPNPNAQGHMIARVLRAAADVHPRSISYIEAHGTGTALGDPIEITGLGKAFAEHTNDKQFCAIGSVKSNIGHCEGAAGIAGVTKVLLQMKHATLVPSLHAETLNPNIDFASSPFFVQRELTAWKRPVLTIDGQAREYPRIAGISSFGAGGSNAHLLIEEYCPTVARVHVEPVDANRPALIVLSARTAEGLQEQGRRLLRALQAGAFTDHDLADIAYTLQVGRDAMEHRLAFTAVSLEQAKAKLASVPAGMDGIEECYRGEVKRSKGALHVLAGDDDLEQLVESWLARGKHAKLLELWAHGMAFDWHKLYEGPKPRRISLPTYPFARERCWVPVINTPATHLVDGGMAVTQTVPRPVETAAAKVALFPLSAKQDSALVKSASITAATIISRSAAQVPRGARPGMSGDLVGSLTFAPVWEPTTIDVRARFAAPETGVIIIGGDAEQLRALYQRYPAARVLDTAATASIATFTAALAAVGAINHVLLLAPDHEPASALRDAVIEDQRHGTLACFRLIKALLQLGLGTKEIVLTVVTVKSHAIHGKEAIDPTHAGVHGLVGSMAKEYPNWRVRLVDVESSVAWPLTELLTLPPDREGNAWAHRGGQWFRQQVLPVEGAERTRSAYKQGGVYVVLGGAGAIGRLLSEYLVRTYQARVIWLGRRAKDADIERHLNGFTTLGPVPHYIAVDGTHGDALAAALAQVRGRFGRIDGVIHSAVGELAKSLAKMDEAHFASAVAPKLDASVHLVQALGNEAPDFVLFFSSTMSYGKSAGNAGYSTGCVFQDALAHQLSLELRSAVKVINWGYWGDHVGVVATSVGQTFKNWQASIGTSSIEPSEAMEAVEQLLAGPFNQVAYGKISKAEALATLGVAVNAKESLTVPSRSVPSLAGALEDCPASGAERRSLHATALPARELAVAQRAFEGINTALAALLFVQLQAAGVPIDGRSSVTEWKKQARLPAFCDPWLEESLRFVSAAGYLRREGDACAATDRAPDAEAAWRQWKASKSTWLEVRSVAPLVRLVDLTILALPEIVRGKRLATDILFPGSSMDLVAAVYRDNPVSDYFNSVLAGTVAAYIERRWQIDPAARVRILEIGAGTGGTSRYVLERIQAHRASIEEYCYTDVSRVFLRHAEKEYWPHAPYLTYQLFDVEKPPAAQSIDVGGFDIVIAANVLHATRDIRATVRNAKATLKANGLLLLNEIADKDLISHLTFGLLPGWWAYEDQQVRIPGSPALYPATWQSLLLAEGFRSAFFPARDAHGIGQQVIVAESDGVIRQPRQLSLAMPSEERVVREATTLGTVSAPSFSTPGIGPALAAVDDVATYSLENRVRAMIMEKLFESLKIEITDADAPLAEYGLDSITGVHVVELLNQALAIDLGTPVIFEHGTVARLAKHILDGYRDAVVNALPLQDAGGDRAVSAEIAGSSNVVSFGASTRPAQKEALTSAAGGHANSTAVEDSVAGAIAITALSGIFPQAGNLHEYWENLRAGKDCITEVPAGRWSLDKFYRPNQIEALAQGKSYCKWGGFLGDPDMSGNLRFLQSKDIQTMHRVERLFLGTVANLIENAGHSAATFHKAYQGKVGVYLGAADEGQGADAPMQASLLSGSWVANRTSYFFNLRGPSLGIDSMSSSSMTAIHMACSDLLRGECEVALAGGISVLYPSHYLLFSQYRLVGSHPNSRSFTNGDGYLPAEAVGAVLLKPLAHAIADGDNVLAVIRVTAANHSGNGNAYLVPNPNAQTELIENALQRARIDPLTISCVEAAANGSALGDAIEVAALTKAFQKYTNARGYCAIGSAKSNIGHAAAASGISQLAKVVLQLQHQQLVPTIMAEPLNPDIHFERTPFRLQRDLQPWSPPASTLTAERQRFPRRALINSFGAGGSYATAIIEEYSR